MRKTALVLLGAALASVLLLAACKDDGSEGNDDGDDGGTPSVSPSPSGTSWAQEYCADDLVDETVDRWVNSVTLLVEDDDVLEFRDEAGFRRDVEEATLTFCGYGQFPPNEAVQEYCLAITRAIEPRLKGPVTDVDEFLTMYYINCDNTDQPTPAQ
jgi:hypothetical protein